MSTDIRSIPAFGKRSSDAVWARARRNRRELTICPWRFSALFAGCVAAAFLLLLDAMTLLGGGGQGLSPVGAAAAAVAGAPGLMAGVIVLAPAALLAQCAWALLSLALRGEPLILVDGAGLSVTDRADGVIMAWEEVARIAFAPGIARLERKPGAVPRLCAGPAYDKKRARVPLMLVSGGAHALKQAIGDIRPDMARRLIA